MWYIFSTVAFYFYKLCMHIVKITKFAQNCYSLPSYANLKVLYLSKLIPQDNVNGIIPSLMLTRNPEDILFLLSDIMAALVPTVGYTGELVCPYTNLTTLEVSSCPYMNIQTRAECSISHLNVIEEGFAVLLRQNLTSPSG